jgi:hypothetical protein
MNNLSNMPVEPGPPAGPDTPAETGHQARRGRAVRWGIAITLAAFLAGGGLALAATSGGGASASGQGSTASSTAQLNALLNASGTSTASTGAAKHPLRHLGRLRGVGGMYGSFTFQTKSGTDETLAFERGTIQSVGSSDVVVRAPDGTTMTWLFVSDTHVRNHGKSSTSALSQGQLVFVGGPVVSGARDALLIAVRTGGSASSAKQTTSVS